MNIRPGHIVFYDNGWQHSDNGRPHIVFSICPSRGLRLCPVTSTPHRLNPPLDADLILARPGGFSKDGWVAAVTQHGPLTNNLCWADRSDVGRIMGQLTQEELNAAGMSAARQLKDRKRGLRRFSRRQAVMA